jgi:hypothetical protein
LNIEHISATRVKTDYARTRAYMLLQSVRVVNNIVQRREALGFTDHVRRGGTHADIAIERQSLGHPGIFNPCLRRTVDWRPPGFTPLTLTYAEVQHAWHGDVHVSRIPGFAGGAGYTGQTFVCAPDTPDGSGTMPTIAGGYVVLQPGDVHDDT